MRIIDYIHGNCEFLNNSQEFVGEWIKTNCNPCSTCGTYKPTCGYHEKLVKRGLIAADDMSLSVTSYKDGSLSLRKAGL